MPKFMMRLVSLLVTSCLLQDAALAVVMVPRESLRPLPISKTVDFNSQALNLRSVNISPMNLSVSVVDSLPELFVRGEFNQVRELAEGLLRSPRDSAEQDVLRALAYYWLAHRELDSGDTERMRTVQTLVPWHTTSRSNLSKQAVADVPDIESRMVESRFGLSLLRINDLNRRMKPLAYWQRGPLLSEIIQVALQETTISSLGSFDALMRARMDLAGLYFMEMATANREIWTKTGDPDNLVQAATQYEHVIRHTIAAKNSNYLLAFRSLDAAYYWLVAGFYLPDHAQEYAKIAESHLEGYAIPEALIDGHLAVEGLRALQRGDPKTAVERLEKSLFSHQLRANQVWYGNPLPGNPLPVMATAGLARAYRLEGRLDEAAALAEQIESPGPWELYDRGLIHFMLQRYAAAYQDWEPFLSPGYRRRALDVMGATVEYGQDFLIVCLRTSNMEAAQKVARQISQNSAADMNRMVAIVRETCSPIDEKAFLEKVKSSIPGSRQGPVIEELKRLEPKTEKKLRTPDELRSEWAK
jgi:hypothetical protein